MGYYATQTTPAMSLKKIFLKIAACYPFLIPIPRLCEIQQAAASGTEGILRRNKGIILYSLPLFYCVSVPMWLQCCYEGTVWFKCTTISPYSWRAMFSRVTCWLGTLLLLSCNYYLVVLEPQGGNFKSA